MAAWCWVGMSNRGETQGGLPHGPVVEELGCGRKVLLKGLHCGGPCLVMAFRASIVEGWTPTEEVANGFPFLVAVLADVRLLQANGVEEALGGILSGTELIPCAALGASQEGGSRQGREHTFSPAHESIELGLSCQDQLIHPVAYGLADEAFGFLPQAAPLRGRCLIGGGGRGSTGEGGVPGLLLGLF
jgi:hypothetical protein